VLSRVSDVFCSTVIPTIGRATLTRAVESVLGQASAGVVCEVIVVNDAGYPLPPATWMGSERVTILETQRRERSVARNAGAALVRGRYVHFLDDDDWLAPSALGAWQALAKQTQAAWLYGSAQLVDRLGRPLIQLKPGLAGNCFAQAMAGEWLPLQASLIRTDTFISLGGFNPLITGPEDIDLWRRFARISEVAGTPAIVANISWGSEGSTTPRARHAEYSRWAREHILALPGVFDRLLGSAPSAFWRGRVTRLYLTSAAWNVKRGRWLTAASRTVFAAAALAYTGPRAVLPDFWRAVIHRYDSPTFRGGSAAELRRPGGTG
jgi:hypothetical protein